MSVICPRREYVALTLIHFCDINHIVPVAGAPYVDVIIFFMVFEEDNGMRLPILLDNGACNPLPRHFPTLSVLRRHPAPSRQQFEGLLAIAEAVGIELDVGNSKKLARSLDSATREGDPYFNKLLRILSTR